MNIVVLLLAPILLLLAAPSLAQQQDDASTNNEYPGPYEDPHIAFGNSFLLHRSPCPAINALANHGVIPRDGINVDTELLAKTLGAAFGVSREFVAHVIEQSKKMGVPTTTTLINENVTTWTGSGVDIRTSYETFNLTDLYAHNVVEHDASLVREDEYFEPFAQFSQELFDEMVGDSDVVTREMVLEHRLRRIRNSLEFNPEATFTVEVDEGDPTTLVMAGESFFLLLLGTTDSNITEVATSDLESFLKHNKFPPVFESRRSRGLSDIAPPDDPLFQEIFGYFYPAIVETVASLENATETNSSEKDSQISNDETSSAMVHGDLASMWLAMAPLLILFR